MSRLGLSIALLFVPFSVSSCVTPYAHSPTPAASPAFTTPARLSGVIGSGETIYLIDDGSGDVDGRGVKARLPWNPPVTVDTSNNLLVGGEKLRKITPDAEVSTLLVGGDWGIDPEFNAHSTVFDC